MCGAWSLEHKLPFLFDEAPPFPSMSRSKKTVCNGLTAGRAIFAAVVLMIGGFLNVIWRSSGHRRVRGGRCYPLRVMHGTEAGI